MLIASYVWEVVVVPFAHHDATIKAAHRCCAAVTSRKVDAILAKRGFCVICEVLC